MERRLETKEPDLAQGLAGLLRTRTARLHDEAERSGTIADLLRGRAERFGYALLQRNLVPVYEALEAGLERHRGTPGVRRVAQAALYRTSALRDDLGRLGGRSWRRLPRLPAGIRYAARVRACADDEPHALIGHAYVRHLGDLSGGRILGRLVERRFGLAALDFHRFPGIDDPDLFRSHYRASLDHAGREVADLDPVVAAAREAFQLNIDLSKEVQDKIARENGRLLLEPA
jgi:heme oxygenase